MVSSPCTYGLGHISHHTKNICFFSHFSLNFSGVSVFLFGLVVVTRFLEVFGSKGVVVVGLVGGVGSKDDLYTCLFFLAFCVASCNFAKHKACCNDLGQNIRTAS